MPRDVAPGWCDGKVKYLSGAAAAKARKSMKNRTNAKGVKLEQFHCNHCGGWHLGNPMKASIQARRKAGQRFHQRHPSGFA